MVEIGILHEWLIATSLDRPFSSGYSKIIHPGSHEPRGVAICQECEISQNWSVVAVYNICLPVVRHGKEFRPTIPNVSSSRRELFHCQCVKA